MKGGRSQLSSEANFNRLRQYNASYLAKTEAIVAGTSRGSTSEKSQAGCHSGQIPRVDFMKLDGTRDCTCLPLEETDTT